MEITQLTHAEYCANRSKFINSALVISGSQTFFLLDGQKLTPDEFEKLYPTKNVQIITFKQKKNNKGKNPNQSKNFFGI